MRKEVAILIFGSLSLLSSCKTSPSSYNNKSSVEESFVSSISLNSSEESSKESLSSSGEIEEITKLTTTVYGKTALPILSGDLTYTYEGKDIYVDEASHTVSGTLGNTKTLLAISNGIETKKVLVEVRNRDYVSKHVDAETSEGWFDDVDIAPVSNEAAKESFASGMDLSSSKLLIDSGQRFYNASGEEESLYRIVKEAGVSWVRFRLWHDPYNHNFLDKNGDYVPYGGGNCDLNNVTWMCKQAKYFGLKVLLDIHYSDFWTEPNKQVIPKAWANITNSDDMAKAVSSYTTDVLSSLKEAGATPDCVSIGNETTSGILLELPGVDKAEYTGGNPGYIDNRSSASSSVAGKMGSDNYKKYIKAGVDAVKSFDSRILTMVHIAKGFSAYSTIKGYFDAIDGVDYDIIGLSGYSYYHYSNISTLTSALDYLSSAFPSKKIALAETSYGFTYESDSQASNVFQSSGTAKPVSGYPCSIQGQASIIADTTHAIASIGNGWGCFYWEGAWTPKAFCGWGDKTSTASWANQAFFSYNGKALGSLSLYKKLWS
ncbi:MAG: arabinogalactan endo-1,4-beta-galactosidase [Bacilli bacterium]|nr:arabinogalactan endo-1,4-beta-galactosidase [Bacilli bacterium]